METENPPKVRLLGWKPCYDILPTRSNLKRQRMMEECVYPRCYHASEDAFHIFFLYSWAKRAWHACGEKLKGVVSEQTHAKK